MSWNLKTKIPQQGVAGRILTPLLQRILVGENEDKVLIWKPSFNNWSLKGKNPEGNWSLKAKISP